MDDLVFIGNPNRQTGSTGKYVTTTTEGSKEALDVNIAGSSGAAAVRFAGAYTMGYNGSNVVSTTVLRVGGASNWTGAATNAARDRTVIVTNCSATYTIYAIVVASGSGAPSGVSAADFEVAILPGQYETMVVPGGYDIVVLSSAAVSSTDKVHARELLWTVAS